jgi:hypothetical protein
VVAVLGVVPVVAGVVVLVVAAGSGAPLEFGWTSYRPLESEFGYRSEPTLGSSDRWTVLWSGVHLLGAAVTVPPADVRGVSLRGVSWASGGGRSALLPEPIRAELPSDQQ